MLRTFGQLQKGRSYNVSERVANDLIARGIAAQENAAVGPTEIKPVGPKEIKPIEPSESKAKKKTLDRAKTARES